jgi:PAS domain S-box-containing protein
MSDDESTIDSLKDEISELRARLCESEETLRAIREGEVDALVVSAGPDERVFTLHGADVIYRTIIETMNEGALTLAGDGTILYCNRLFARLVDADSEDVIGTSMYDYITAGEAVAFDNLIGPRLNRGLRGEFGLRTVSGDKHPVFISTSRLDLGDEAGFGLIVTDLAEQKRADRERAEELERVVEERTRELATSEKGYRDLVQTANSIVMKLDVDGTINFVNRYGQEFFGYTEEELVGKNVVGTILPEVESTGRDLVALAEEVLADPDSHQPNINENINKDGARVWVSWTNHGMRDRNGNVVENLAIGNDITDLKRKEEELSYLTAELDSYAHTVSHDLRSPLSAIAIANALIKEDFSDVMTEAVRANLTETADTIDRNLSRAYALIDNLLALAEAGREPTKVKEVDVSDTVREILAERAPEISNKGVNVFVEEDLGVVKAHPLHIYQVFTNLIGNAIKHNTSSEPAVTITYLGKDSGGVSRYKVCDNGPGVPESEIETIFMPFTKSGDTSDTGVGLSIVKKIVEVYGGNIRAYNDNGACFEFTLRDWEFNESA